MDDLVKEINKKVKRGIMPWRVLLSRFGIIDSYRSFDHYTDPDFLPFYYYLGQHLAPTSLLEFGTGIGLRSGLFLASCKTAKHYLGIQDKTQEYYTTTLARRNIRQYYRKPVKIYHGHYVDEAFERGVNERAWDLVMINERYNYAQIMQICNFVWERTSPDGMIIIDGIHYDNQIKTAYQDFCKIVNRSRAVFKTKYGVGLLRR